MEVTGTARTVTWRRNIGTWFWQCRRFCLWVVC